MMVSVLALGLIGAVAVGTIGDAAVAAERAQATADASALAGAIGGDAAARSVAAANGAGLIGTRLVPVTDDSAVPVRGDQRPGVGWPVGTVLVVELRRAGATATAAASAVRLTP